MKEYFNSSKSFRFYMILSLFKDKANISNKDNEYPVKFQYFAKLFHEMQETYFNRFFNGQELGLIK